MPTIHLWGRGRGDISYCDSVHKRWSRVSKGHAKLRTMGVPIVWTVFSKVVDRREEPTFCPFYYRYDGQTVPKIYSSSATGLRTIYDLTS